jgi:DNA polymerase I-like protein with 3'-5' exonuclease and polymerase domains
VSQEQAMTRTYLDLGMANGLKSLMANKTKKYSDLINFGSPTQIKEIFKWANVTYGTSVPTMEKKDDKKNKIIAESTGEIALQEWLIKNTAAPDKLKIFVSQLLDYRAKSKLISQYGYGLLYTVMSGHRIHTNYGQCFTNTGRLNSFEPNLQNIPRDNTIRNLFVPDEGYIFFDWDFDGQEIKIAANYSEDKLLLAAALEGADIHSTMASISFSLIFGQSVTVVNDKSKYVEVVSPLTDKTHKYNMATELRQHHKNCLFAIN